MIALEPVRPRVVQPEAAVLGPLGGLRQWVPNYVGINQNIGVSQYNAPLTRVAMVVCPKPTSASLSYLIDGRVSLYDGRGYLAFSSSLNLNTSLHVSNLKIDGVSTRQLQPDVPQLVTFDYTGYITRFGARFDNIQNFHGQLHSIDLLNPAAPQESRHYGSIIRSKEMPCSLILEDELNPSTDEWGRYGFPEVTDPVPAVGQYGTLTGSSRTETVSGTYYVEIVRENNKSGSDVQYRHGTYISPKMIGSGIFRSIYEVTSDSQFGSFNVREERRDSSAAGMRLTVRVRRLSSTTGQLINFGTDAPWTELKA